MSNRSFQFLSDPAKLTTVSASILVISMTFSPFLLSIGMWLLVIAALLHTDQVAGHRELPILKRVWATLVYSWHQFVQHKYYLVFTLLFGIVFVSGLWSSNLSYWLMATRIRLPFLILPWAFSNLPTLSMIQSRSVLYYLICALAIICIGVGVNFALDPDTILRGLSEGQPVPVPRHHIRFSLIVVMAILAGGWLWGKNYLQETPFYRKMLGVSVVFLFICIHLFSVRSAIVALYASLLFSVARYVYRTSQWKKALFALAIIVAAPVVALKTMPSIQQRLAYMIYDWQQYKSAQGGESYSDSERFVSLRVGWEIFKEHPLIGVGMGDMPDATQAKTNALYPSYNETPKLPHNQFIYILAGSGVLGMVLSLFAFLYPFNNMYYRGHYLFVVLQVVVLISFLVEYTLETSIGTSFYLFFQLWTMKVVDDERRMV